MLLLVRLLVMAIALGSSLYTMTIGTQAEADEVGGPAPLFAGSKMIVGERLSVEIVGSGPDLIFIPGLASSRATWKATAERLKTKYRLHLIQVAGFAGEPARANGTGSVLVPTAEAIDAYIVANHLAPATVIGHSLGGTMALWLAENHPAHVKKILVVDALPFLGVLFGGGDSATAETMKPMADSIRAGSGNGATFIATMVTAEANKQMLLGWAQTSDVNTVGNALADDITLDLRPELGSVATPVTLLYPDTNQGAPDGAAADSSYAHFFAVAPQIKRVRIDNARHFIMLDQPDAFAAALDAFLAE